MSQALSECSIAASTDPSATSRCAHASENACGCQARRSSGSIRARLLAAKETTASSTAAIVETRIGSPFANAPSPRRAHQRRPECGRRGDADVDPAVELEPEQREPDGDPARVVPRAVDRVDDPAPRPKDFVALSH